MAVRRLSTAALDPRLEQELLGGLKAELLRPDGGPAPQGAPTLYIEDSGGPDRYTHWYAVWDRFAGVDGEERSRLLLTAVREVQGVPEALRVSIAMGLTPKEAAEMGLEF